MVSSSDPKKSPRLSDRTVGTQTQQLQELLASIVESSEDAIIAKTVDGTVTAWNAAAERMYGYKAEEVIGKSIDIIAPTENNDIEAILARIRIGERVTHYQTQRKTKDGRIITVSLTVSPLRNRKGEITGASVIARDITDAKKTEAALRNSEKLATVGRLAATIAHEINNPLEAVANVLYLLEGHSDLSAESRKFVEVAQAEVARISHIVKQTLGFHRESPQPVPIDFSELVESVLDLFRRKMEISGISLQTRYEKPHTIPGFPGEMRQVFSNLVSNAIEAMPHGGQLAVSVRRAREHYTGGRRGIRVTIADSGSGIDAGSLPRIFEPFFTTKGEKGTGLGLWVSLGIINQHGGVLRARSFTAPQRHGTAFTVFIPDQYGDADHEDRSSGHAAS